MCLAIPSKVEELLEDNMAKVSCMGAGRVISIDLVPSVKAGDYVLMHAGFAIEIIDEDYANETLELIAQFPELIDDDVEESIGGGIPVDEYGVPTHEGHAEISSEEFSNEESTNSPAESSAKLQDPAQEKTFNTEAN